MPDTLGDEATPNMNLILPGDNSPMSDVDTYLNNNFTKIKTFAGAKRVTAVPDTYTASYNVGDRIYVTSGNTHPSGIYVCIGKDPLWGIFWRPLTNPYGPWFRPGPVGNPNSIIGATADFRIIDSDSPFQYRLTNKGSIQFRGCIQATGSLGTIPDVSVTGYAFDNLFNVIPECIRPGASRLSANPPSVPSKVRLQTAPYPVDASATVGQTSYIFFEPTSNKFVMQVNTDGASTITKLFFSGAEYFLGDMGFSS